MKKTVLVSGGAGFIGSHVTVELLEAGYDVVVADNFSNCDLTCFEGVKKITGREDLPLVRMDFCDAAAVKALFAKYPIDAVIHFAAFSQVAESMSDPAKYYRNNVTGTMNLLDSMVAHDVKRIVFSSTAATYGEPDYTPIDEKHPQNPINPYGRTKLDIEYMMDDYDRAYGLKSVRLRYFNVAGADSRNRVGEFHEPETHLIPNILKSLRGDERVFRMYGTDYPTRDGTCVRDYIDIEDLIEAHMLALDYLMKGGATDYFNLGTNDGSTVREVFSVCEDVVGSKIPLRECARRPGDPATLVADNAKAKRVLGWAPKKTLKDSVTTAWAWERSRQD
jgi:UDP-glucose 4-epimerase